MLRSHLDIANWIRHGSLLWRTSLHGETTMFKDVSGPIQWNVRNTTDSVVTSINGTGHGVGTERGWVVVVVDVVGDGMRREVRVGTDHQVNGRKRRSNEVSTVR